MGLFKKEKEICPICQSEMGFFTATELENGKICDKCAKKIKQSLGEDINFYDMSIEEAEMHINAENERLDEIFGKIAATDIFEVYMNTVLNPKALDVGIKKAKELKGKIAVLGAVKRGTFFAGDKVLIIDGERETAAEVYGVYENLDDMSIYELIAAGNRKKGIDEKIDSSYIVFSTPELIAPGNRAFVIKK